MPKIIVLTTYVLTVLGSAWIFFQPERLAIVVTSIFGAAAIIATYDYLQRRHTILRNFPLIGHVRFLLETIRPEIQQYFIESYENGRPFSREMRSVVYQRAKNETDTQPFGTQQDLYHMGAQWIEHSIHPEKPLPTEPRVSIGGPVCRRPYLASYLNISAMSYGSLGANAVRALGRGAKGGNFYQNTGEGGLTPYHLETGASIVWQIGTGYFGCRTDDGGFSREKFRKKAQLPNVVMIELKISQGAKPGHGGILPAAKVTKEISEIRDVPLGKDVISPGGHSVFKTPMQLLDFLDVLREESDGKPVGFKLCIGKRHEFLGICKAMIESGRTPDFITVDGAEGGTGAAPLEFINDVGTPLIEALAFVHSALTGAGLRDRIKVIASGKVISGFDLAAKIALGADLCNCARGMMFAVGCIQALRCNTNRCPTGVATLDPVLQRGLVVSDKSVRVTNYHKNTVRAFLDVIAATGKADPTKLDPSDVKRLIAPLKPVSYADIFTYLEPGALLNGGAPEEWKKLWDQAHSDKF